jgi:hypothetical protein
LIFPEGTDLSKVKFHSNVFARIIIISKRVMWRRIISLRIKITSHDTTTFCIRGYCSPVLCVPQNNLPRVFYLPLYLFTGEGISACIEMHGKQLLRAVRSHYWVSYHIHAWLLCLVSSFKLDVLIQV